MTYTAYPPSDDDKLCAYCDSADVRVIDNDGYAPNELVCEDCFFHHEAYWDDLPRPIWPMEVS